MIAVYKLGEDHTLWFDAKSPYEAMEKLIYTLYSKDKRLIKRYINLEDRGRILYVDDGEDVWYTNNVVAEDSD